MKRKTLKTVLRIVLLCLAAVIVGYNVYSINAERLAGNSTPMPFGVGISVVLTDSMKPEFSGGDLIIFSEKDSYKEKDVVVFKDGRSSTVHRIIEIDGETVITKGDNNNTPDAPIEKSQIIGAVDFSVPYVGFAVNAIKTPLGTVCIIILAIWLMERSIRLEKAEKQKELDKIKEEIRKLKGDID